MIKSFLLIGVALLVCAVDGFAPGQTPPSLAVQYRPSTELFMGMTLYGSQGSRCVCMCVVVDDDDG